MLELKLRPDSSNGSMKRVVPLAIWCSNLSNEEIEKAVFADASFTHSNPLVHNITSAYCIAIKYLIQNPNQMDRAQKAFDAALEYAALPHVDKHVVHYLEQAQEL